MTKLFDLILDSAKAALPLLDSETGAMPPGHNGPYQDAETPVRNTSHWLVTFLKAHTISGREEYVEAARHAAAYLQSDAARPAGATFWHRKSTVKDRCNGLIGQAWTIEALASAAAWFPGQGFRRLGQEVFLLHPFDADLGLWRRVDVDGSVLSHDSTFNHQLWFAAAGALLLPGEDERQQQRIVGFLDRLAQNMRLYPSGLIHHALALGPPALDWLRRAKRIVQRVLCEKRLVSDSAALRHKAVGYHGFNLYAFALLRHGLPAHPFWETEQVSKALAYVRTNAFVEALQKNRYGYPYNPAGFEVAFALHIFCESAQEEQERWVWEQLRRTYDDDSRMLARNTGDPVTLAARLYEATRLPNLDVRGRD